MRAVAHRLRACLLATAKMDSFCFFGGEDDRLKSGVLVHTITKWLFAAKAARAPGIFITGFDIHFIRRVLRDFCIVHDISPAADLAFRPKLLY